jgi:hypothetical protein
MQHLLLARLEAFAEGGRFPLSDIYDTLLAN